MHAIRRIAALILLLGAACATTEQPAEAPDKAVYAAAFAWATGARKDVAVVVCDRTATGAEMLRSGNLHAVVPRASERLAADFLAKSAEAHALTAGTLAEVTAARVEVVPSDQVSGVFAKGPMQEAWRELAARYHGARSIVTLSPVAYDPETNTALVYLRVECGGLCGGGTMLFLERRDGAWRVAEPHPLWR